MNQMKSRTFLKQSVAVAVTALMMGSAQAATQSDEVKQLREEVKALKALIMQQQEVQTQQQQVQSQQHVQIEQMRQQPATTAAASPFSGLKSKAGSNVNIYGFVRADANYVFKGGNNIFNRIDAVDLNGVPGANGVVNPNKDRFYSTVNTSRLGLDFKAPVQGADVGGKLEIDVGGANANLRIRHAYMTYNNWLVGQTTSNFLSLDTQSEMIDYGTPAGQGTTRTPMVRYSHTVSPDTHLHFGVEQGRSDNKLPSLTAKLNQKYADGKGLVTARALVQETRAIVNNAAGKQVSDSNEFGWGAAIGTKYNINDQLSVTADYSHVKGDDKFISFTGGQAFKAKNNGKDVELIDYDAVTAGITYKFSPQWRSTLGYGAIYFDNAAAGKNDTLQQGWLNVLYNPVKPITFGVEYTYGERQVDDYSIKDKNDNVIDTRDRTGRDSRIGLMAKYDF